jgi:hypothetical protein
MDAVNDDGVERWLKEVVDQTGPLPPELRERVTALLTAVRNPP